MRTVGLLPLACILLAGVARAGQWSTALEVSTVSGVVQGALQDGVVAFKGIPYAAPPVGPLRWAPPQPVKDWQGVRRALVFGPDCMQLPTPGDMAPLRTRPAENCLYLNIWRPKRTSVRSLPVMVWIYGGGFVNGGTSPAVYDGSAFARDGVVLVSFNYRVGNFGFFAFPALLHPGSAGNYALMDQIAALTWVRRNIAAFGGDPHNVTIFGESAGGMSVAALLEAAPARGLFQKAIIESGAGRNNTLALRQRSLSGGETSAEAISVKLARHLGVIGEDGRGLDALRALPALRVVDGLNMASMADATFAGAPIIDSELYFGAPVDVFAEGKVAPVAVMIGANSEDSGFMPQKSLQALFDSFGPDAVEARAIYDKRGRRTLQQVSAEVGGVQWMIEPARAIARVLSARGQRVYEYRFSYVASSMRGTWHGAPHATEIPFVFDTVRAHYGNRTSNADRTMARMVQAYWIAFAKTGRPDPVGEPTWPEYHIATDRLMNFTDHGPVAERDPWRKRLDLAERAATRTRAQTQVTGN
jgi:para-nitrobenzyl esterase